MQRTKIGVFFGGQSPEHEVSVITGLQAAAAMNPAQFDVIPIYVTKAGHWFWGEDLGKIESYKNIPALLKKSTEVSIAPGSGRTLALIPREAAVFGRKKEITIDVAFLAFHGGAGENGAVQGICEAMNVPYTGSGVGASAIGMDKVMAKKVCHLAGIPVVEWVEVWESDWRSKEEIQLNEIESKLEYPVIVKPGRLGSSIGISKVNHRAELDGAIEEAFRYDVSVVVERCIPNLREINCSVLGSKQETQVSVMEEPVSADGVLSFKDKYMRPGSTSKHSGSKAENVSSAEGMASLDRLIPAPISDDLKTRIGDLAQKIFLELDCSGLVRIDFLMNNDTQEVWFNEINTIPGSLSFYLWKPSGIAFDKLVERLINLAVAKFEDRSRRVRSYDVNLLAERSAGGLKGGKS